MQTFKNDYMQKASKFRKGKGVQEENKNRRKSSEPKNDHSLLIFEVIDQESDTSLLEILPITKRYKKKKIYHNQLRKEYRDILPQSFRERAT